MLNVLNVLKCQVYKNIFNSKIKVKNEGRFSSKYSSKLNKNILLKINSIN